MSAAPRALPWEARARLLPMLDELSENFETPATFGAWRRGVLAGLISGDFGWMGIFDEDALRGGLLHQGDDRFRLIVAGLGELAPFEAIEALRALKCQHELVFWFEESGPAWAEALASEGARAFERITYVQDLSRVAFAPVPSDAACAIAPWAPDRDDEACLALFADQNVDGLEGAFLTLPRYPDEPACRAGFAAALAGEHGAVLGWASFTARDARDAALLGAVLMVQGETADSALLFEIGVTPAARGRQTARRLVQAVQRALSARGYSRMLFHTAAENTPVHRLFRPEEILHQESTRGGYWQRGPAGTA